MKVSELMNSPAQTCAPQESCHAAARIMWEHDCGCVPVTDDERRLVGVVTDRDIAMAAHLTGNPLGRIPVGQVMGPRAISVDGDASVHDALQAMADAQVLRLPVVDSSRHVIGVLALSDAILAAPSGKDASEAIQTVAAIAKRRTAPVTIPSVGRAQAVVAKAQESQPPNGRRTATKSGSR
jgi:CBS domain-containing protein